jgi:hypothetical protein
MDKQIRLNLEDGTQLKCHKCGGVYFLMASTFFSFSKILTGTDKDAVQEIPIQLCGKCGEPLQELLPNFLKTPDEENIISVDFKPTPKSA